MVNLKSVSIIVPTYNEAKNIKKLVEGITKALAGKYKYEILVVDDNSPDGTYNAAKKLPSVRAVCRKDKRGLSSAVIDGFAMANGDIIAVMDADLSHPPKYLPDLLRKIAKHDIVVGSRLVKGGSVEEWPMHRKMMSFGARMMALPLTRVRDTMSGFFVVKREVLKGAKLEALGYKILLEVLVKGNAKKVKEVPFIFVNREIGESKIGSKVITEYLKQLAKLYGFKAKRLFV